MRSLLAFISLLLAAQAVHAQDHGLYWKYKDYKGAVALSVPAPIIDIASWFADNKEDRRLMRKVNRVRVLAFEGTSPVRQADLDRFMRKARRRHLEDLIFVREGRERVHILAKERGRSLRKVVVLVQSPDEFVLITLKGRFRYDDIESILTKYGQSFGKDNKPVAPPVVKVPVSRI